VKYALGIALLAGLAGPWVIGTGTACADELQDQVAFTDMDQMIFDARQAFKQKQFDVAITTCEKILRKDPNQITALKMMGSGYFMLEQYDRARHVWERALEVAPDDPDIPKYMERLPEKAP
jgi:Tfp pilus assembly protein PilF